MSLRIEIPFTDEDYKRIEEKIKEGRNVYFFKDTSLDKPIAIRESVIHQKGNLYGIRSNFYISDTHSLEDQERQKIREAISKKYNIDRGNFLFSFRKDGLEFVVDMNEPFDIYLYQRLRPIENLDIEKDIKINMDILEKSINAIYDARNIEFDFCLRPNMIFEENKVLSNKLGMRDSSYKDKLRTTILEAKPKITFEDIGGCRKAKKELKLLAYGLKNPEVFQDYGLRFPRGILLYGPPGTGKTLLAKAFANEANATFFNVKASDIRSCFVGESEKYMDALFDLAIENSPSVILMHEIDSIGRSRYQPIHSSYKDDLAIMLERMDGMKEMDKVIVFGTTNMLEEIDPALLRPGRFDEIIEVPLPQSIEEVEEIYRIHLKGRKIANDIDYEVLAKKSKDSKGNNFSGAKIEAVCRKARKKKVEQIVFEGEEDPGLIDTDFLLRVIEEYKQEEANLENGKKDESYRYIG